MLLLPIAFIAVVYLNPGSLHQVVIADYDEFDRTPDIRGVVNFHNSVSMNFGNVRSDFSPASIEEIRRLASSEGERSSGSAEVVAALAMEVHSRLSRIDSSRPLADSVDTDVLFKHGRQYYAICSDYARLMTAALQAAEIHARIIWMEGHVAVEYFDTERQRWIFVDPYYGLMAAASDHKLLSVSQLIYTVERDLPFRWKPIIQPDHRRNLAPPADVDTVWYRNVLLNGECHCLSADTLDARGRWTQLLLYRSRPQILFLRTPFDTSAHSFSSRVRPREVCFLWIVLATAFHLGRWFLSTNKLRLDSDLRSNRAAILPDINGTGPA